MHLASEYNGQVYINDTLHSYVRTDRIDSDGIVCQIKSLYRSREETFPVIVLRETVSSSSVKISGPSCNVRNRQTRSRWRYHLQIRVAYVADGVEYFVVCILRSSLIYTLTYMRCIYTWCKSKPHSVKILERERERKIGWSRFVVGNDVNCIESAALSLVSWDFYCQNHRGGTWFNTVPVGSRFPAACTKRDCSFDRRKDHGKIVLFVCLSFLFLSRSKNVAEQTVWKV